MKVDRDERVPRVDDPPEARFKSSKSETLTLAGRTRECWVTENRRGGRRWNPKTEFPPQLKTTASDGVVTLELVRIEEPGAAKRDF